MADYRNPAGYARLIPKPHAPPVVEHVARPIDLVKLRKLQLREHHKILEPRVSVKRIQPKLRVGRESASLPASTTGILPWWTYETRGIPGIGPALVNVTNLNLLIAADDVDVPEGGADLAFRRVYNSQSQHDQNNDDNSTPSVFGNKWTNNLDLHLGWQAGTQDTGTVSVYTDDGAREDYSCEIDIVETCSSQTTGVYDLLGTININGGVACQFQWTRKSGVSYIFTAPYSACGKLKGAYGRLVTIYGRNANFYLQLAYSWKPDASNPENISRIQVTHQPDGAQLTLNFGQIAGSSITELMSIERPDGQLLDYKYDGTGDLNGIDKPDGDPVLAVPESLPQQWPDGTSIPAGNLPEVYTIKKAALLEACGPRAAIGILDGSTADGACVDFDYGSNSSQLSDWWTRGVLNPYPEDDVSYSNIQNGPNTGFVQWDDTLFFGNNEGSSCNPLSEAGMSGDYGHATTWCYDSAGRVNETATVVTSSDSLSTSQNWDADNNLISTTDPRGYTTKLAYDTNGNIVEISLPSQQTSQGTLRPTYLFDYDQYNNVTYYCDPANNASNGWNSSQSDTLCEQSGSTSYTQFTYTTDDNEPYGCVRYAYTPRKYRETEGYGGGCGVGLPTSIAGDPYTEADGTDRTPTQSFTYYGNGTLATYNPGTPKNHTWQLTYTSNGMNRVRSAADPDGVTSYRCYNPNGSVFYGETAYENLSDNSPNCPSVSQIAGGATPPPFATAYGYDPDGDVATTLRHHDCPDANGLCAANNQAATNCNKVVVPSGMTCNFYDGLGRLVEVKQAYDKNRDLYTNPWITRYLYDLTGSQQGFHDQSFLAYGNLFQTQELLPPNPTAQVTSPISAGSVANPDYKAIKGTAYDGLDRPVAAYSAMGTGSNYTTETLTWDAGPLDSNIGGFLGKDCNSASPAQCQKFDYTADGELMTFESSDGSSPERDYTYDPDGRPTQIASQQTYSNPQKYAYDVDGNLQTSVDASNGAVAQNSATLTHNRYPDGSEMSLDVSSGTLSQNGLFTYSYRNDGPLQTEVINDGSLGNTIVNSGKTTLAYTYTEAERLSGRSESGAAANLNLPATSINYLANLGLVKQWTTAVTSLSQFSFTFENEMVRVTDANCQAYVLDYYSLRGELTGSQNCSVSSGGYMANGVHLQGSGGSGTQSAWNDLMAVMTGVYPYGSSAPPPSTWSYDQAGRMTSQTGPYPQWSPSPQPATATRTYDAENHVNQTTRESGNQSNWPYESVSWGPDGHPISIGASKNGGSPNNERLHWDGDQLLFTTHNQNGNLTLDDIKVDAQGDILPGDTYSGLTFYDRGPGGVILGCHNSTGNSYVGFGDSWMGFEVAPCGADLSAGAKMPTSTVWVGSPYTGSPTVGTGGTLGMPRLDGFTDGFDTIQGVRSYDSSSGSWTTPDVYAGVVEDPASQKSYLWNGNNPMDNTDPSGYVLNGFRWPNWGADPTDTLWDEYLDALFAPNAGLLTIATVTAHCHCMQSQAPPAQEAPSAEPSSYPVCALTAGSWVCQDWNYQWRPLPNIMGTGKYVKCGAQGFVNSLVVPMTLMGMGVGGVARRLLVVVGLDSLGPYLGPAGAVGVGAVQSYTGWGC